MMKGNSVYNDGINRSKRRRQTGEDFTPTKLVFEILRKLPKERWTNPNKTWFDPACGNGQILVVTMRVLRYTLRHQIPNQKKRQRHIVTKMIYGVDIMRDNVLITCKRLGVPNINKNSQYVSKTIVQGNTLVDDIDILFAKDAKERNKLQKRKSRARLKKAA